MRKLKLDVCDLEVSTFDVEVAAGEQRGTVAGHKLAPPTEMDPTCNDYTCDQYQATCNHTCANSCWGDCPGVSFLTDCSVCFAA